MKTYRIIDKTEPRFRLSKFRYVALNRDLYNRFKEKYPNINLAYEDFKSIIISGNERFVDLALENRDGVALPFAMGKIKLGFYKPKKRPDNDHIIEEKGFYASHFNLESGGLVGKIVWTFEDMRFRVHNTNFYSFQPFRGFKIKASKQFREHPENYSMIGLDQKRIERYKIRKQNDRDEINSEISDQPNQDAEQGSEC